MDDASLVQALDSLNGLRQQLCHLHIREPCPAAEQVCQCAACAALQEEVYVCFVLKGTKESDDVWVFQPAMDGNLCVQLLSGPRLLQALLTDHLMCGKATRSAINPRPCCLTGVDHLP
eukprot:scaffold306002_cov48-Prasinocladus_malaysianus.AAC.2